MTEHQPDVELRNRTRAFLLGITVREPVLDEYSAKLEELINSEIRSALQAIKLPEKKRGDMSDHYLGSRRSYNAAIDACSEILEREKRRYG